MLSRARLCVLLAGGVTAACAGLISLDEPRGAASAEPDASSSDAQAGETSVATSADGAPIDQDSGAPLTIPNAQVILLPADVTSFVPIVDSDGGFAYLEADAGLAITELRGGEGSIRRQLKPTAAAASISALNYFQGLYTVGGKLQNGGPWGATFAMDGGASAKSKVENTAASTLGFADVAYSDGVGLALLVDHGDTYAIVDQKNNVNDVEPVADEASALALLPNEENGGTSTFMASEALHSPGSGSLVEVSVWFNDPKASGSILQGGFFHQGQAVTILGKGNPTTSHAVAYGGGIISIFQTDSVSLYAAAVTQAGGSDPTAVAPVQQLTVHAALSTNVGATFYAGGCAGQSSASVPWMARFAPTGASADLSFKLDTAFGDAGVRAFPELPAGSCIVQLREDDTGQVVALIKTPSDFSALVRVGP